MSCFEDYQSGVGGVLVVETVVVGSGFVVGVYLVYCTPVVV